VPATTVPGGSSAPVLNAYLALPPVGSGPWPGVVVLHEAFGLTDDIRQLTDRVATAGYVAVAPDLYSNGGVLRCLKSVFGVLAAGKGPAFDDIDATRTWLAGREDCTGTVGVVGFCMGGSFALLAATRGFDAAAPNYGVVPPDAAEALRGACPIVASYGRRDVALRGAAGRLEEALTRLDVPHDVHEYPEAGHSFLNRHNGGPPLSLIEKVGGFHFHQPSSEDAWRRIFRFFDEHLR
jgi:carboxymethylenebutenolidase